MTITAARVEVLTAEVRVPMIGSRQVTLSVYGQLDSARPARPDRARSAGWRTGRGALQRRVRGGAASGDPATASMSRAGDSTGMLWPCSGRRPTTRPTLRRDLPLIVLAGLR